MKFKTSLGLITIILLVLIVYDTVAPPVTGEKKKDDSGERNNEVDQQVIDVEYKRYLEEVVQLLESDDDFRQRLMKADPDDIKSGNIAKDIEFVNHNVRSKLDELKRQELERLRHAALTQYEQQNGIDRKHMKIPAHLDPHNPHTFEAEDLRKLITQTTKELEDADKKRRQEFKEYEMQKELQYQEQLKNLDEDHRLAAQKQHEELMAKHRQHPSLHHPGSKPQLEQVWEEQDHMSPDDFNPKTFFHLHDLDGNGVWDAVEVKALFKKELDKMYDPNAPEDDIKERYEEMERMREHIFNESDTNKDNLISYQEFLDQTKKQEFERDEGWDPIDQKQHPVYNEDEYRQYAVQHEQEIRRMMEQGLIPQAPPGFAPLVIPPGHALPPGVHPSQVHHQVAPPPHPMGQNNIHPNAIPPGGYHPNAIPQGQAPYPPQQYHHEQQQFQQQQQQHPNAIPQHHQQQQQQQFMAPPPPQHQQQQQQQQYQYHQEAPAAPAQIHSQQQQQQGQQHAQGPPAAAVSNPPPPPPAAAAAASSHHENAAASPVVPHNSQPPPQAHPSAGGSNHL